MSRTCMQSFSFIPLMISEEKIFSYFFEKFTLYVAMATNKIQRIGQNSYESIVEAYLRNVSVKKKNLNICSETAKIANFYFSHCKSMETISCHSNQIGTKNTIISSPHL